MHLAVDAIGKPLCAKLTAGNVNDCTIAIPLLKSLPGSSAAVLADRGYDSDVIVRHCLENNSRPVIPPHINRKEHRPYDRPLYRLRYCVENAFLRLKVWRSITTCYTKRLASLLTFVHLACVVT